MTNLKTYVIIIIENKREVDKMGLLETALFELKIFYRKTEKDYKARGDDFSAGYLFGLKIAITIITRLLRDKNESMVR